MISNTSAPSPAKPVLMPGAYAVEDLAKKKERQRSKRLTRQSIRSGASKDKRGGKDAKNEKGGKSSKSGKKVTDTALEELERHARAVQRREAGGEEVAEAAAIIEELLTVRALALHLRTRRQAGR